MGLIRVADQSTTITPGANTAGTITLTGVPNKYHYILAIQAQRTCTITLAGTGSVNVTTTNVPGGPQWTLGNAMTAGATQIDINLSFAVPLRSSAPNTNTTFVFAQPGAAVGWNATVFYMISD